MFKNLTIGQISLYITFVLAVINVGIIFLITGSAFFTANIAKFIIFFSLWLITSFLVIRYLLERFVFRKIKIIYKFIHKAKLDKKEPEFDIETKSLESVNTEVIEWARDAEMQLKSLKSLEAYRKNFVGNVSHELKTPIFSIQGYLHTLLDGGIYDNNINVKYIRRAAENTERLKNIIEDLESISRLEEGELLLDIQKFDIKELTLDLMEDLAGMAKKNRVSLSLKAGADGSFMTLADKDYIRQVLSNLIVNSIKYGKKGGKTKISFYDLDDNILVEVSDDGVGITEEDLKHVFDRFYRVDKSRSRSGGGSGLGLSIVKHIIEAHNQTINVRSTLGIGSTFGFTLKKA